MSEFVPVILGVACPQVREEIERQFGPQRGERDDRSVVIATWSLAATAPTGRDWANSLKTALAHATLPECTLAELPDIMGMIRRRDAAADLRYAAAVAR